MMPDHPSAGLSWAVALVAVILASAASADCQLVREKDDYAQYRLRLPDGQNSTECRRSYDFLTDEKEFDPLPFGQVVLDVSGSGLLELEVRWQGSAIADHGGILGLLVTGGDATGVTASYGDIIEDPNPKQYRLNLVANLVRLRRYFALWDRETAEAEAFAGTELVMTLRRVNQSCWMKAWVTGDVPTPMLFHGDVAWFRTSEEPVKPGMMMGSLSDTELAKGFFSPPKKSATAGALDLAAQMGAISKDEAAARARELENEAQAPTEGNQSFSEWLARETRAGEGEAGDDFGLNLVAIDLDANPRTDLAAAQMFTSAFSLALSGTVRSARSEGVSYPEIQPSLVQATVGVLDRGGGRIPFGLGELAGTFTRAGESRDLIIGFLAGELETEGPYTLEGITDSPRVLKVGVVAKFAARRGTFSCSK